MASPIKGTKGNDLDLLGTNGADQIQGKDGNDFITGGRGNDDIDGGKGFDTAVYSGDFADYQILIKGTGNDKVTVTDTVAGRDGSDSLKHIEALKFNDVTIRLDQNNAAIVRDDVATTNENSSVVINALANDTDFEGDTLTITAVAGQAISVGGSVTLASGAVVTLNADGTLTYDTHGAFEQLNSSGPASVDNFSYTVSDSHGADSDGNIAVTVTGVNDAPVAQNGSATGLEDNPISGAAVATDVDNTQAQLTYSIVGSGPAHGTIDFHADGTFIYTPFANYNGSDSFSFKANDGSDDSNTGTVSLTVQPVDDIFYFVDAKLDPEATKAPVKPNEMIAGSGIPADHFGLVHNTDVGVELGLKIHNRFDINHPNLPIVDANGYADGELHFQATAAGATSTRASWNFDFSIATGLDGQSTGLSDFTFQLLIDVDKSTGTDFRVLEMSAGGVGSANTHWTDMTNPLHPIVIGDDAGIANKVAQNSENFGFGFIRPFIDNDPGTPGVQPYTFGPGHFDIILNAYQGAHQAASNHMVVDVI